MSENQINEKSLAKLRELLLQLPTHRIYKTDSIILVWCSFCGGCKLFKPLHCQLLEVY